MDKSKKVIKFNVLFSNDKHNDYSSTFHYYYDVIFLTVVEVLDTSGRRFGYSTHNWSQSPIWGN